MKTIFLYLFFYLNPQLSISPANWYLYQTSEISIEFPEKPQIRDLTLPSEIGDIEMKIAVYAAGDSDPNRTYLFSSSVFPEAYIHSSKTELLDDLFDSIVEGAMGETEYTVESKKTLSMSGYPGREIKLDTKDGKSSIHFLLMMVENRGYVCQTIADKANKNNESGLRFHRSFSVKK